MEPLRRPPSVEQAYQNKGLQGPKVPIYPICERIWRRAVSKHTPGPLLDDGDDPFAWKHAELFDAARAAVAKAEPEAKA